MKAHIYEPKALPGVELGAGALFLGEPTEENKICDIEPGAYAKTRQDKTGIFIYTETKMASGDTVITPCEIKIKAPRENNAKVIDI